MRYWCAGATIVLTMGAILEQSAVAQVNVYIATPTIRFEVAPPLVVVSPGVMVVPDYEEEVFFVNGWYWCRRGPYWYRARDHRGGWVVVERQYVPVTLVKTPPGHYKHYKASGLPPGQAKKLERNSAVATPNGPPFGHVTGKRGGGEKEHGESEWEHGREGEHGRGQKDHGGGEKEHGGGEKEHGHGRWKD
jgi:hypothetical protein